MQNQRGYNTPMQPMQQHHQGANAAATQPGQPGHPTTVYSSAQAGMRGGPRQQVSRQQYAAPASVYMPGGQVAFVNGQYYMQGNYQQPMIYNYPGNMVATRPTMVYQQQFANATAIGVPHAPTAYRMPMPQHVLYSNQMAGTGAHAASAVSQPISSHGSTGGPGQQQQQAQIQQATPGGGQQAPQTGQVIQGTQQVPQQVPVVSSGAHQHSAGPHQMPAHYQNVRMNESQAAAGRHVDHSQGQVHVAHAAVPKEVPPAKPRQRRILEIKDPNTGKLVVGPTDSESSSTSESAKPAEDTADTQATPEVSVAGVMNAKNANAAAAAAATATTAATEQPATEPPAEVPANTDDVTSRRKAEFFAKISQANDDTKKLDAEDSHVVQKSDKSDEENVKDPVISAGALPKEENVTVEEALADAAKEEVGSGEKDQENKTAKDVETSKVDDEKADQESMVVPTDEDRKKDENQDVEVKPEPANEEVAAITDKVESMSISETPSEETTPLPLTNGLESDKFEEDDRDNVPSHDISTVSISPTPLEQYDEGDYSNISDDTSLLNNSRSENAHEDDVTLEEGELEDKEGENDEKVDANGESEPAKPKVRRFTRDQLLAIGQSPMARKKVDIPITDVLRDNRTNAADRVNNFPMNMQQRHGPRMGGPRGGMRPIQPMMGMGMGPGAMWSLNQPLHVPPRPPGARIRPPIITLSSKEVELHKDPNAWKPGRKNRDAGAGKSTDEIKKDQIIKTTRGVLNKLTPENFEKLVQKLYTMELQEDDERITSVIKVVFEKAVDEPNFATSYARLVQSIVKHHTDTQAVTTAKKFRKFLLDTCQQEFQKTSTEESYIKQLEDELANAPEDKKELLTLELEDKRFHMRRKKLGNVRFIGELYKLQMLTPRIMVECVHMLLGREDQDENKSDEESIECLCKLLTTVGEILENQLNDLVNKSQQNKSQGQQPQLRFVPEHKWMDNIFNKLRTLSRDNKLSSRIRFGLLDVIELRENSWKPRRDATGPKTIDEVRRDAARQEAEEKQRIQALPDVQQGRRANMNIPLSTQGKKGSETKTSTRFQQQQQQRNIGGGPAGSPVLGPPSGWGLRPGNSFLNPNLPPRLLKKQGESPGRNNSANSSESGDQRRFGSGGSGGSVPHLGPQGPPSFGPPSIQKAPPVSRPTPPPSKSPENVIPSSATDEEAVKNLLGEYFVSNNYEDTEDWILKRFEGLDRLENFVDLVSRRVSESSKEAEQRGAGKLIKTLVKSDKTQLSKDKILAVVRDGTIQEIPDIMCDSPKVALYIATFVVEMFGDEPNLSWLVQLAGGFDVEVYETEHNEFIEHVLEILKRRTNESHVKSLWEKTDERDKLLNEGTSWLNESKESIAKKMIPVLQNFEGDKSLSAVREEFVLSDPTVSSALVIAICEVCHTESGWDVAKLENWLPLLSKTAIEVPDVWKTAKEFIESKGVSKSDEDVLWERFNKLKLVSDKR